MTVRPDTVRFGVLGCGYWGPNHIRNLTALRARGAVMAAAADPDEARRRHIADLYPGVRLVPGADELIEATDIDALVIATPVGLHFDQARRALENGKHVLVEKPFTMNAAEAEELVATARDAGLFLMEAMWARFVPQMVEVRRLLAEGALGEVVTVIADHGQWFAEDREFRLFAPELGGGALLDLGIYPVSFASMVLGTPDRVVALADPAFTGVDAQTSILLGHPGGAHAVLTCTLAAKGPTQAAIIGTEARIEIEGPFYAPSAFTLTPREGEPQRSEPPHKGRGMLYEADEVARCIGEGLLESPAMPLDETVAIMRTMDAVSRSASA